MHTGIGACGNFVLRQFCVRFNSNDCIPTETRPTPILHTSSNSNLCPKCGTVKKSGKYSCCARDGAWFKNCGDAGDTNVDHTWAEGIQACKGYDVTVIAVKSALQETLDQAGTTAYTTNTTPWRNVSRHRTSIDPGNNIPEASHTNSKDCRRLRKATIGVSTLLISFLL